MTEYINKEFYKEIPANERHYINLSASNIKAVMDKLNAEGIPFSATLSNYKNVVTVRKSDSERAAAIVNELTPKQSSDVRIIGNIEYKYISDKRYINMDSDTALKVAAIMSGDSNNRFSGRIVGDKATITVSGDRAAADVRRIADNIKNADLLTELSEAGFERVEANNGFVNFRNKFTGAVEGFDSLDMVREMFEDKDNEFFHPTAYRIKLTSDEYEFNFYIISCYDNTTGEEIEPYYENDGAYRVMQTFGTVDEALEYAASKKLTISNSNEELDKWRAAEVERENEQIAGENRSLIADFPKQDGLYPDRFRYNKDSNSFMWTYFNPEGDNGSGIFVEKYISEQDIYAAHIAMISADNEAEGREAFLNYIFENCRESNIDIYSGYFADYAKDYINKPGAVEEYYGIGANSTHIEDITALISRLEDSCAEIKKEQLEAAAQTVETEKEISLSDQLVDLTDSIVKRQEEFTECINTGNYEGASAAAAELAELSRRAEQIKAMIQEEAITTDDVDVLRSIKPERKSVQNMLETEVAQTPKFEKLLGEEFGEKSAYAMRNSDNEWRNDDSKRAVVVEVQKRDIPVHPAELLRKDNDIPRGIFVNRDTGIEIQFSRKSIREIVAKAIPDDKRHTPVEARMAALYQMQQLIENAICFDSQISEPSSSNKSGNTLFIHRLYGIMTYEDKQYLANLAVEEMYLKSPSDEIEGTLNRVYSFRDIEITPTKLLGLDPHAGLQNANSDTSLGVTTISIPQLYDIVKTNDPLFYENSSAIGRADREAEIQAQTDYRSAVEKYNEYVLTADSEEIAIDGREGTWYVIDTQTIGGKELFLLESENYGDEAACLIVDGNRNVLMDEVYNGFEDYIEANIVPEGQMIISGEIASDMWYYGYDVYVNGEKLDKYDDVSDKNGTFGRLEDKENTISAAVNDVTLYHTADTIASTVFDISKKYFGVEKSVGTPYFLNLEFFHEDNDWENWRNDENEYANTMWSLLDRNYSNAENYFLNVIEASRENNKMAEDREAALKAMQTIDVFKAGMEEYRPANNKVTVLPVEEKSYTEQLYTRVNDEYSHFIGQMKKESPDMLVRSAAEIADKEKITQYILEGTASLSDEQYEALLSRENPLDEIYEQWVQNGELSSFEDVGIALEETANRILISLDRENSRSEEKVNAVLAVSQNDTNRYYVANNVSVDDVRKTITSSDKLFIDLCALGERQITEAQFAEYSQANGVTAVDVDIDEQTMHVYGADKPIVSFDEIKADYDEIAKALDLKNNTITFSVVAIEGEKPVVVGSYIDKDDITALEEYQDYIYDTGRKNIDVTVDYYTIGMGDNESYGADTDEKDFISEHLDEVLKYKYTDHLESETYFIATPAELLEEISAEKEKNYLFTVAEFEDGSRYVIPGEVGDDNIKDTAAWQDVKLNNFDIDNVSDLDEDIRVTYTVYQTGIGEAVIPTAEEAEKIEASLDEILSDAVVVDTDNSSVRPWDDVDDVISRMEEVWKERHEKEKNVSDGFDNSNFLYPNNLMKVAHDSEGKDRYNFDDAILQIKLARSEWLRPVDAVVEMNRRGVDINDIEMLNVRYVSSDGTVGEKDVTPEQYMVYLTHSEERTNAFLAAVNAAEERKKIPENIMKIIRDDMPSFVKSAVAWDELMEYDGISEKFDKGENPVEVVKSYLANNGTFSWNADELKDGYFDWTVKDNGDTADIYVSVNDSDTFRERYNSHFEVAWTEIANAFKQRIEQELNYNKISDGTITVTAVGEDDFRLVDRSNGYSQTVLSRERLLERFSKMFNKEELNGIINAVIGDTEYEEMEVDDNSPVGNLDSEEEKQLEKAKEYISNYLAAEFLSENVSFDDLKHISAGYTELGENNEYGFQMEIDLINLEIRYMLDNENVKTENYNSLEEMNELALSNLNFDEFLSEGTSLLEEYESKQEEQKRDALAEKNNTLNSFLNNNPKAVFREIVESAGLTPTEDITVEEAKAILGTLKSVDISLMGYNYTLELEPHDGSLTVKDAASHREADFVWGHVKELMYLTASENNVSDRNTTFEERAEHDNTPKYEIYQIPAGERYHDILFTNYDHLQMMGQLPDRLNYEKVYSGRLDDIEYDDKLEGIFIKFNADRPEDFAGHSLSVSDVIVIEDEKGKSAHFVDSIGFRDITDIFLELDRKKEQNIEQINISDYSNVRFVNRSEWDDMTLSDAENPAFEEITVSFSPNDDGSYTKYHYNVTNSAFVDTFAEENNISGEEMLDELAKYLEIMELSNKPESYHFELTDLDGNSRTVNGNNLLFVMNEKQPEILENSVADNDLERSMEDGVIGSMGYPVDEMNKAFEAENSRTDYGYEQTSKKSGSEIEVGDRFLYNDREYTVTSEKGIYPDDVGVSYEDNTGGIPYVVTSNIDRYKLAENGVYLGNPEKEKQMENSPVGNNNADGYEPKIGDLIEYQEKLFRIADINGDEATLQTADTLLPETTMVSVTDLITSDSLTVIEESGKPAPVKETAAEQPAEDKPKAQNFVITNDDFGVASGAKTRYADNVAAIKTLKEIEAENRTATPEEQEILSKYTGWGAIPQAFDINNDKWRTEYAELRTLLTPEEYAAARKSTMNAHYTSPTVISAIYEGLKNLGFESGKILEPAVGIGNFFGVLPEEMRNSQLFGVELDSLTGRIAQQLYPEADIQIKGFEQTAFADNSFDIAIGNVPFGDYKVNDRKYNDNNFLIHDYFFAKALDKVRPGGVVAFVTSKGTLDKENSEVRKYLAQRAELLGAIRLPNNAFKANAGTEVTSDIIFLQKRERPIEINPDDVEWLKKAETPDGFSVNNYFVQHPEMVLGTIAEAKHIYGPTENTQVLPIEGADLKQQLSDAMKNIQGQYRTAEIETAPQNVDEIPAPANSRKYSFYAVDGNLYYREAEDTMKKVDLPTDTLNRAIGLIGLRDNVRELLDLQLNNSDGSLNGDIAESRKALNNAYDNFVAKYGNVSDKKNAKAMQGDDGYNIVSALEIKDEKGKVTGKADIFTHDTVKPKTIAAHVDTAEEALILSISEKAKVDFEFMSELCGMDKDKLISELTGQIFRLPQEQEKYVTADEYLTGNIRKKLRELENAPEDMDVSENRKALEAAMPPRVEAKDISVKLGAHWVDPKYIEDFIKEKFNPNYETRRDMSVQYSAVAGTWKIEDVQAAAKKNYYSTQTYGTQRMHAYAILEAILNNRDIQVKDRVKDENGYDIRDEKGNYVLVINDEETKAARRCANVIKAEFEDWIFRDPDRREALVQKYNEVYNSIRHREYDGSHLSFVGMNRDITLKEHQKNAVARGLYGGNSLLAHAVGAGKTFEMIAIAMEGKRLGLHNKCLFAVPNALTEQMGSDFRKLYPNANILVATQKDFEKENRLQLLGKIAANDWDAVIVGHSQFDRMGLSPERERAYLVAEVNKLRRELEMAAAESGGKKSFTVKQIEKSLASYESKLEKLNDAQVKDGFIDFEQLGFDKIFVDESHMYKNLATATKMHNVSGLGSQGSARAFNLLMKSKYLDEITGGRGLTFASGTPISNSMTELYTLMRYLQAGMLKDLGINHFDEWAADFGEVKTDYELKPESDGKYQLKTRFAKFTNLPELMAIFKEAADIRTADTLDLEKPKAVVTEVVAKPSKIQKRSIKSLGKRATKIRNGNVDPRDDNMLKITSDGRKIGLDQRLLNPALPDDPESKVNLCVGNVFDIYSQTADKRSTQCIFCDLSTPKSETRQDRFFIYRPNSSKELGYDIVRKKTGIKKDMDFAEIKKHVDKNATEDEDKLRNGDIAVIRRPSDDMTKIISEAAIFENGKFNPVNSEELLEKLAMSPVEEMPPKEFNVYDDIKDKLVAKGVPEKEIAFIHDYDTPEQKQKLFNQMNAGEVRILLGSTAKCGAGMNAQQKMIALHHLDAPMRPSDMEQRNGRIERQGNENPEVQIFRYVTDKTFDAYLYQMLENKQRFISQVMTSKTPERTCADIDEQALDYAEVKALCAGNVLIKEEMQLQTQIKELKSEKSRYSEKIYELQDNIRVKIPASIQAAELHIKHCKADFEIAISSPKVKTEEGKEVYPIKIGDKVYTDRAEAGEALKEAILKTIGRSAEGKTVPIGEYRGMKLSVLFDSAFGTTKACLEGEKNHYCDLNLNTAIGSLIRLDNCINNIEKSIHQSQEKVDTMKAELEQMKIDVEIPFPKAEELRKAEARLDEVHEELTRFELTDDTLNKDIYERFTEAFPDVMFGKKEAMRFEAGEGWDTLSVELHGDVFSVAHTYEQNGDLMYDPLICFKVDYEKEKVIPVSYENSGMGIYETYDPDAEPTPESVQRMASVLDFTDTWLDNIEQQGYEPAVEDEDRSKSNDEMSM